jgi:hypothetical protein
VIFCFPFDQIESVPESIDLNSFPIFNPLTTAKASAKGVKWRLLTFGRDGFFLPSADTKTNLLKASAEICLPRRHLGAPCDAKHSYFPFESFISSTTPPRRGRFARALISFSLLRASLLFVVSPTVLDVTHLILEGSWAVGGGSMILRLGDRHLALHFLLRFHLCEPPGWFYGR